MSELGEKEGQNSLAIWLSTYKLPLIFASVGLILFIGATVLIIRQNRESANVVFITQATESAKLNFKVDVEGAVINPGIYELPEGSRISDALTVAGGFSLSADRDWVSKNLNRATRVVDGGKIYIPTVSESSSSYPSDLSHLSNLRDLVNINTASSSELETLPGIGPKTAAKIRDGRPYLTIEELKTKKIVGDALFEKIKDNIVL